MGDSLVQYRPAIALFNCFKFVSGFIVFLPPILLFCCCPCGLKIEF